MSSKYIPAGAFKQPGFNPDHFSIGEGFTVCIGDQKYPISTILKSFVTMEKRMEELEEDLNQCKEAINKDRIELEALRFIVIPTDEEKMVREAFGNILKEEKTPLETKPDFV
jgi:hypothetical protein